MYWQCVLLVCLWVYSTDSIESRVFEAQELRYEIHTYLVHLGIQSQYRDGFCSGSIISSRRIITSAHCVTFPGIESIIVYRQIKQIGEADMKRISIHPNYNINEETNQNRLVDIALIRTQELIAFNKYVKPIALATVVPKVSESAILAGVGEYEGYAHGAREGAVLMARCPYDVRDLICSKDKVRAGGGDSGGALLYKNRLAGVTSASCKDVHVNRQCITVYSNIAHSLDWIRKKLAEDN